MNEKTRELQVELRDAQGKAREAESALAKIKGQRIQVAIWSAIGGFLLFAVGGQWFPGYQLDSTAMKAADSSAASAVSEVMSELCAERFMAAPGLEARMAGLKGESSPWNKATYIREGGWSKRPNGEKSDHATAERCAVLIGERVSEESDKTS